LRVKS